MLWLVRHGNRADFVDPDWGKTAERPHDSPLSRDGVEQARAVGRRLAGEGIARIFTSPYLRCAQTAHEIARSIPVPVHVEPGLGELHDPDWTAGLPDMLALHDLARLAGGAFDDSHAAVHEATWPETVEHAFKRSVITARALADRYAGPLLLVGHAVSVMGIARGLSGFEGDMPCSVASIFRLDRADAGWNLVANGDTSHLGEAIAATRFH